MPYPKWKDSAKFYYQKAYEMNIRNGCAAIALLFGTGTKNILKKLYSIDPNDPPNLALGLVKWGEGDTTGFGKKYRERIRRDDPNSNGTLGSFMVMPMILKIS